MQRYLDGDRTYPGIGCGPGLDGPHMPKEDELTKSESRSCAREGILMSEQLTTATPTGPVVRAGELAARLEQANDEVIEFVTPSRSGIM